MRKILYFVLLLLVIPKLNAQSGDYKFHSVFIYNFTKYIQWPPSQQTGEFVIGVLGNSPAFDELQKITGNKLVGTQKIIVKKFKSAAEIEDCHILFVPGTGSFESAQAKLRGKATLIVTEKSGLAQKGSSINFVMQDNKWKFELNESTMQSAGLKVSKELTKLAILV